MPVSDYLAQTGIHAGWAWLGNLGYGDMLNFSANCLSVSPDDICYLAILPGLMRKKDTAYVVLVIVEVVVLAVAASGILGSGGH